MGADARDGNIGMPGEDRKTGPQHEVWPRDGAAPCPLPPPRLAGEGRGGLAAARYRGVVGVSGAPTAGMLSRKKRKNSLSGDSSSRVSPSLKASR